MGSEIRVARAYRASGLPHIAAIRTPRSTSQFGLEAEVRCSIHQCRHLARSRRSVARGRRSEIHRIADVQVAPIRTRGGGLKPWADASGDRRHSTAKLNRNIEGSFMTTQSRKTAAELKVMSGFRERPFPPEELTRDQAEEVPTPPQRINVVLNWIEELKERVPVP